MPKYNFNALSGKFDLTASTPSDVGLGNVDNLKQIPMSYLDTDGTLSSNSDTKVATQKATKTYADQLISSANALVYKGVIDCSANPNYPAADAGHLYIVSVAGKIGGASGITVDVGDLLICNTDGTPSGTQATVGIYWNIIEKNIIGAVSGPASSTDGNVALFDGVTGKLIKNGNPPPANTTGTTGEFFSAYNSSTGAFTKTAVTKSDVGLSNVENTALSIWGGSFYITSLGTITFGTWNANIIESQYGGTGINNGGRTLTIGSNSGSLSFTNPSTTLTIANTASISGTNTGDQDLSSYFLLTGRAGGQTAVGGTAAANKLILNSTSHATKGMIEIGSHVYVDEANGRLGVGINNPQNILAIPVDQFITAQSGTTSYNLFGWDTASNSIKIGSGLNMGNQAITEVASIEQYTSGNWKLNNDGTGYLASNLGLGLSSMSARLHIKGSGSTSATNALLVENSSSTQIFNIKNDGYIGFGTASTTTGANRGNLELFQDINDQQVFVIVNPNTGTSARSEFRIANTTSTATDSLRFFAMGTAWTTTSMFVQDAGVIVTDTGMSGGMSLGTRGSQDLRIYTNATERIKFIGSTASVHFNSNQSTSIPALGSTLVDGEIHSGASNSVASDNGLLRLSAGGGTTSSVKAAIDIFRGGTDASQIRFYTSGTERMRIFNTGEIVIGGTSAAARLEVDGAASGITAIFQANATTPGDLLQLRNSSGTVLTSFSSTGTLNVFAGIADNVNIALGSTNGTKIGTATTQKIGFFNATPIVQPSAYTQTYSTADKTIANISIQTLTAASGTGDTTVADVGTAFNQTTLNNNFKDLANQINNAVTDITDLKQAVNALIDDFQNLGLVG